MTTDRAIKLWRTRRDRRAAEWLVSNWKPLAMLLARKATIPQAARLEMEDVEAIALHVLWKTIEAYDPSKAGFTTYAYNRMPRLITNLAQTHIDAPRWVTDTGGGQYQVQRAYERMLARDGWPPTAPEIAAEVGIRSEYVAAILTHAWEPSAFSEIHDASGDTVELEDLLDSAYSAIDDGTIGYVDPAEIVSHQAELSELLGCLDNRERTVICALYLEDRTLRDVGISLGVTGECVRQIANKAMRKVRVNNHIGHLRTI